MNNANQAYNKYLLWILSDENSVYKTSRAGGTIANSGATMKFNLADNFSLINTKQLFHRGVIHEMVWFMRGPEEDGELHIDYMIDNKCNFWNKDLHVFYNKKRGVVIKNVEERDADFAVFQERLISDPEFRSENGSLGRPYGAQWRDWRGSNGKIVDQLANAFQDIKNHSDSRRIIVEAWRPDELDNMALPSCHKSFQFLVMNDRLDIVMNQRSADSFLGVPFNIMQYGLMGRLASEYANLKPGIFTHQLVDAHIYCGVGKKAEWYKNNLPILKEKVSSANKSDDYLEIKNWIDTTADRENNPKLEDYDHVTGVLEQLANDANKYPFAKLEVIIDKDMPPKDLLNNINFNNFKITGYKDNHYPAITRTMPTG